MVDALVFAAVGVLEFVLAFGLWWLRPWAWPLGVVLGPFRAPIRSWLNVGPRYGATPSGLRPARSRVSRRRAARASDSQFRSAIASRINHWIGSGN